MIQTCFEMDRHLVDLAESAKQAMSALAANEYDLIIMDWGLPDGSGMDVCKRFRQNGGMTPVLVLTARGSKADMVEALDGGADDYIAKPFDAEELLARSRALLRRPATVLRENISLSGIHLDPNSLQVKINDETVQLSLKEFSLLELLMRHPGKSFTPEGIVHRLWPSDTASSTDTVRTHIKNLRKKIGDVDGRIIISIRGLGYSFGPRQ